MVEYVLVTGASSGIGLEMAKILASKKMNLVLVARNLEKLELLRKELTETHAIDVITIAKDLSVANNARDLHREITEKGLIVTKVINNAGSGIYGSFLETSLEEELSMIELNVLSLVVLTKLFAQDMVKRGSGNIMNVASLLSFIPLPYYAVYSATKTFVLAFTETIAAEMEGTNVVITALCPGPIDTPFTTTEMLGTKAYKANPPADPKIVAKAGVDLLLHGRHKKIVGFNNWFISNLPRITPDRIMMKIKKSLASKRK